MVGWRIEAREWSIYLEKMLCNVKKVPTFAHLANPPGAEANPSSVLERVERT